jgi:shikimate kinase
MPRRYYLIGFMGTGKTYWGTRMAQALNCPFIDLDEALEGRHGMLISAIFEQYGEHTFRQWERQMLLETALEPRLVVATGGGTPCFADNMDWMNKHGITIFLPVPVPLLAERLRDQMASRPLLQGLEPDELPQFIEHKLHERMPYYEKAGVILPMYKLDADWLPLLQEISG